MTAGAIFDFIRRVASRVKANLLLVALGISCFTATVVAQDVTITNPETTANNNSSSPPAGWSEPPPLNEPPPPTEPPSDDIDSPLPVTRSDAAPAIVGEGAGYVSALPRKFHYMAQVNVRGVYDDNIFLTKGDRVGDFYFTIEPQITLAFGDIGSDFNYVRLDYALGAVFYADHSSANALQHVISLQGQYHFPRLSITLTQDIALREGANINSVLSGGLNSVPVVHLDTGGNTEVNTYATSVSLSYDLMGKTSVSGGIRYSTNDYGSNLIGSETIAGNLSLNYNYRQKLTVGFGGNVGYNSVESPSHDQSYEQIKVHLNYEVSDKLDMTASGGIEFREFSGNSSAGTRIKPVYELELNYQPFDGTTLALRGRLGTENSAVLGGQDYYHTSIGISARQRLLQRIYLAVAFGYEHSSYFSTVNGVDASRKDDYFYVQPAIDLTVTRYGSVGAYYLHRQNKTLPLYEFYDNQVGLRTSISF